MRGFAVTCLAWYAQRVSGDTVGIQVESWDNKNRGITVNTASTIEVDIMPFLARVSEGGPFKAYQKSLQELGAEFVRFAPWYPYPLVAVTELYPPDCTASKPSTNWNSTLFDGIMKDFMEAVCGPDAVKGKCLRSVAQQLSTMPSWLYIDGVDPKTINPDPWQYNGFGDYNKGTKLHDETCVPMAQYMARIVAWYTTGGFHDTCGHFHDSGLHYNWTVLSILNENERNTGTARYTICFDAIRKEVEKVNSYITLAGPEYAGDDVEYTEYVMDPKNHKDGRAPDVISIHAAWTAGGSNKAFENWFDGFDKTYVGRVAGLNAKRDQVAPTSSFILNEFIPFMNDWCDEESAASLFAEHGDCLARDPQSHRCPSWENPKSNPVKINRKTMGWSSSAALFAYGYGKLALAGYKAAGADQLIGGPWPDNEPAVSCLDWKTGEPNAKYYAVQMIAKHLAGAAPKTLLPAQVSWTTPQPNGTEVPIFVLPYVLEYTGQRGLLLVSKVSTPVNIQVLNSREMGAQLQAIVLEGVGAEPGFAPPTQRLLSSTGALTLGPFAVAIVEVHQAEPLVV